jgi:hypothetical protein
VISIESSRDGLLTGAAGIEHGTLGAPEVV